jgi:hypothetical protein
MSASTTRLGLTKPGGGSTGLITPADIVDIDVLNANFDKIDASMGYTIATSGARPSTPFNGQPIFETDTKNEMYWSTAAGRWIPVGVPNAASSALRDALYPAPAGGERVYRTDLGYVQRYSSLAAAWRADSASGTAFFRPTTVGGTGAAINADGVVTLTNATGDINLNGAFPADFRHHRVIADLVATANALVPNFRMRQAGADAITSVYNYDRNFFTAPSTWTANQPNGTSWQMMPGTSIRVRLDATFFGAALAEFTGLQATGSGSDGTNQTYQITGGEHGIAQAYDSLTLQLGAAVVSGTVELLGIAGG